jgi:Protein of unknown function (DUF3073)
MGRGRAKAKQTKVARELKYSSHGTDLDALRAELAGGSPPSGIESRGSVAEDDAEDDDDPYAEYAGDDDEDEADEATGR